MKYINVPAQVTATAIDGSPIINDGKLVMFTFHQFMHSRLTDPSFAKDMDAVLSAVKIRALLTSATDVLELEDADYDRLVAATKSPQGGYNPTIAHNFAGFMQAICAASSTKPLRAAAAE